MQFGHRQAVLFALLLNFFSAALSAQPATTNSPGELAIKKFQVAPGLQVNLFAAEPLLQSPVSFTSDDQGAFYVVETHRYRHSIFDITEKPAWLLEDLSFRSVEDRARFLAREFATNASFLTERSEVIRRIQDTNHDGRGDVATAFADNFRKPTAGTAAGILARDGHVWFTCIPDLWRLTVTNQQAGARQSLSEGYGVHIGVSGHDLHGLKMGPDGRLYFSVGDRGFNVTQGTNHFFYPDTGAVLRCEPDGSRLEVFAIGLRNPQELTFDHLGNLWTADNDTAGADPSRIIHVVEGGDYGWRCSYQHQTNFGPWVEEELWRGQTDDLLPLAGIVAQGPSGLDYHPGVSTLPDAYRNHFFVCDFPGGIWSFNVTSAGASYQVKEREKFLWNLWPTDLEFAADGNLYVSDWVQGWGPSPLGRLYRVSATHTENSDLLRRKMEFLRAGTVDQTEAELVQWLEFPDQRVRQEAQFALARKQAAPALAAAAQSSTNQAARLHALWGLDQIQRSGLPIELPWLSRLFQTADPETRRAAVQLAASTGLAQWQPAVLPLLNDAAPRVQFAAAQALAQLGTKEAAEKLEEFVRRNADRDPFLTHGALMAGLRIADGPTVQRWAHSDNVSLRRLALLITRRRGEAAITQFLNDKEPRLRIEAARAINDLPIPEGFAALAQTLDASTTHFPLPLLKRAVNANLRLGGADSAARLERYALHSAAGAEGRSMALDALKVWIDPGPLDRVMGLHRPVPPRAAGPALMAVENIAQRLGEETPEAVWLSALAAISNLRVTNAAARVAQLFRNPGGSPTLRQAALESLGQLQAKQLEQAVGQALQDPAPAIRQTGVRWIQALQLPNTAQYLGQLLEKESDVRLSQAALAALGVTKDPAANDILKTWLLRLQKGKAKSAFALDIAEAALARGAPALTTAVFTYLTNATGALNPEPYLQGGDGGMGKRIFLERAEVSCNRCHEFTPPVAGHGAGPVGPSLAGIGKRKTRLELLEAILYPNKTIAPGYANVVLTLKNGEVAAGTVVRETANRIELNSPEEGQRVINLTEVQQREAGLSAMPEGLADALSKRELRALLEFLASLK